MKRALGGAAFGALLFTLGCARGPDVQAGLALRRVVIYRNGVGYFERQGKIDADAVTFKVRHEKVGDFLATLAVMEQGGSSVKSASFPVKVDKPKKEDDDGDEADDKRYEILLKAPPKKGEEKSDQLETVKLSLDGKEHDLVIGYVAETPVWRPSYRLVIDTDPKSQKKEADLQAWGIVQNLSGEDWKGVSLSLVAGAPLAFQATLEKPVVPTRPIVTDEGEVIAGVPTAETSLAEGNVAPPPPPAAAPTPSGSAEEQKNRLDDLLAGKDQDQDHDGIPDSEDKPSKKPQRAQKKAGGSGAAHAAPMMTRNTTPGGRFAPKTESATVEGEVNGMARSREIPAAPPPAIPAPPRSVRSLAAVAMESGTTHYDLPFTVDIPNDSATMVLLVAKKVPGEAIFLFAPDGGVPDSTAHPFRVARFTNDTNGLLERGPIAVFANGAFLGQGMVDPLPPGATATVPFALERSLAISSVREGNEEGSRLALIEGGRIEIERDEVTHTKYTVKNGGQDDAKVMVKHPRLYATRLHDAPKGTEDNTGTGTALVPIDVKAHQSAILDVDERRSVRRGVDWLDPLADIAVKAYISDPRADKAVVQELEAAWVARTKLRALLDDKDKLDAEATELRIQQSELDRNLRALKDNKTAEQLKRDLADRLAKASARLDEITKKTIVLDMQVKEQGVRFRDLITNIKMVKPLPPS